MATPLQIEEGKKSWYVKTISEVPIIQFLRLVFLCTFNSLYKKETK